MSDLFDARLKAALAAYADQRDISFPEGSAEWVAVRAALLASDAVLAQAGMVVVPREPTKEMVLAGDTALENAKDEGWDSQSGSTWEFLTSGAQTDIYTAMIDAFAAPDNGGGERDG